MNEEHFKLKKAFKCVQNIFALFRHSNYNIKDSQEKFLKNDHEVSYK